MTFLILCGIIVLLITLSYIFKLRYNMKLQRKIIEDQKNTIERERILHKQTKAQLDVYITSYNQAIVHIEHLTNKKADVIIKDIEYDMDDILLEISTKGINNVSKDKLEFLKKIGKK